MEVKQRPRQLLRPSEWLLSLFFFYVTILGLWRNPSFPVIRALALLIPIGLLGLAWADWVSETRAWSFVRDWVPAVLVLVAYWSADWSARPHVDSELEHALIGWDRSLLNDWGLRAAIERLGGIAPAMLELAYLLLYAVLPVTIAAFYLAHQRERLEDFLFPFLLGTLAVYALLPHFPSDGPRFVFAGADLPRFESVFRRLNVWILDGCDIRSSVFPSGHVGVGFSAAFAMRIAVPRRATAWTMLGFAMLVWINTIYGRYHYAADGLAAFVVSGGVIGAYAGVRKVLSRAA